MNPFEEEEEECDDFVDCKDDIKKLKLIVDTSNIESFPLIVTRNKGNEVLVSNEDIPYASSKQSKSDSSFCTAIDEDEDDVYTNHEALEFVNNETLWKEELMRWKERMDRVFLTVSSQFPRPDQVTSDAGILQTNNIHTITQQHNHERSKEMIVLKSISPHPRNSEYTLDFKSPGTPWTKMLFLEELGTAASWTILLLPYFAFFLSLLLDSNIISFVPEGPFFTNQTCANTYPHHANAYPTFPTETNHSCHYKYQLVHNHNYNDGDRRYLMSKGVAFTTGPLSNFVTSTSTFLFGDVFFENLPGSALLDFLAKGDIFYSTILFQKSKNHPTTESEWSPIYVSQPTRLPMVCTQQNHTTTDDSATITNTDNQKEELWNCQSPRLVNIVFSMPGTPVLTNNDVRVDTILSYFNSPITNLDDLLLHSDRITNQQNSTFAASTDPQSTLDIIASSASYRDLEHPRSFFLNFTPNARIWTIIFTFSFILFWCWSMGLKGFFACTNKKNRGNSEFSNDDNWWESPWVLFPERRYLLLIQICLLLIQNPVLSYCLYVNHKLYESATMHIVADILTGIGLHGTLCLWLCVLQGLRYHTADLTRERARQQKQTLELRRALAEINGGKYVSQEMMNVYYETYGNVHSYAGVMRLQHDPCGENWPDFLLPKITLFCLGVFFAFATAMSRFPTLHSQNHQIPRDNASLLHSKKNYVVFSSLQMLTLAIWFYLILRNAYITGSRLKQEPFLSTRPAQLAFRVLLGILFLGVASIVLPFLADAISLIGKWTYFLTKNRDEHEKQNNDVNSIFYNTSNNERDDYTLLETFVRVVFQATKRFPFSGTAASIGSGSIIYITTCSLISAFIFLPPSSTYKTSTSDKNNSLKNEVKEHIDDERQTKDKRTVVTLARYSHTWRVFPLPLNRLNHHVYGNSIASKLYTGRAYQLDCNFNLHSYHHGKGTIYSHRYMPVFCIELACWLLETSWQSYYSATEFKCDDYAPGRMNLENLNLNLDSYISNDKFDTHAFIASNISAQVDGEEDSIIVVSFRGTSSTTNMRTDLKMNLVPLPDYISRSTSAEVQIICERNSEGSFDINNGIVYDLEDQPLRSKKNIECTIGRTNLSPTGTRARNILKSTPITRQALSCTHDGFLEAYLSIRERVMDKVVEVLHRQMEKALQRSQSISSREIPPVTLPKVYVTGHSYGGALGQIFALDFARNVEFILSSSPIPKGVDGHKRAKTEDFRNSMCHDENSLLSHTEQDDYDTLPMSQSEDLSHDVEYSELKRSNSLPYNRSTKATSHNHLTESSAFFTSFFHNLGNKDARSPIRLQPPIAVYTYGQPRVGNPSFTRLYKHFVPHSFRVINEGDPITSMPIATCCNGFGFYKHAGLEVMLDEGCTGNTLVGPTVVETIFRFTKMRTNIAQHSMDKYRENLESALTHDELQEYYRGHGKGHSIRTNPSSKNDLPRWVTQVKRSVTRR